MRKEIFMLVNLNQVLPNARKGKYAVPAFDSTENVLLRATLDAAQEMKSPVILQFHESDVEGIGMDYITSIVKGVCRQYSIPVVLHLDHGEDPEKIRRVIDCGFTSVMYDGSHLTLEENIRNTRAIVEYAHDLDVTVEAELGRVGGSDRNFNDTGKSLLTDPDDVVRFVRMTNVDALAVSIGTSHGVYLAEPRLNISVLKEISRVCTIPLVIHGGSGNPVDQLQDAIRNGITKVNIFADLRVALKKGMDLAYGAISRRDPMPNELFTPIYEEIRKVVQDKISICGSANRGI